ncbi:MAG: hypothetical protein HY392_04795 [Candidatus Diapherotrites archaeon]|nr:hypothetical protein [Candidatus Diapherotrites archaeon]
MKEFLKQGVLVFVLIFVFTFIAEVLEPKDISPELVFSPLVFVAGLLVLFFPFFASIAGGFFIAKKTREMKPALLVPATAAFLAGLVIVGLGLLQVVLYSDEQLGLELVKASELGLGFFSDMTVDEFRGFLLTSTLFGAVFVALLNFGLGITGGLVGRQVALMKK